ncbi:MAG: hypothetical protein QM708_13615 [Propioniciclava sp.]|uniref:hypothetical protein n=1 Tax=Propioniciclava sp. TaxID=2038686 RepID=UPI0039E27EE9
MSLAAVSPEGADARLEALRRVQADPRWSTPWAEKPLPTPEVLAEALPGGGLVPGSVYSLASGGLLLLSLLAEPSRAGLWCGVVGMPELGAEAAAQAGVNLERLALVPHPGERWFSATAALVDVMALVAVRPAGRVRDADAARLAARLRDSKTVMLTVGAWPRAEATLRATESRWSGLGQGHGCLRTCEMLVTVTSKRTPMPRRVRMEVS